MAASHQAGRGQRILTASGPCRYPDVVAGILIGGRGRRLGGTNKANLLRTDGQRYVDYLVSSLQAHVAQVVLAGRAEQRAQYPQYEVIADSQEDLGPMGGLCELLRWAPQPWVFLLACDMPHYDMRLLDQLVSHRHGGAIVIPQSIGQLHPTCALYRSDLGATAEAYLRAGGRTLQQFVTVQSHHVVPLPQDLQCALTNVNTPEQLLS